MCPLVAVLSIGVLVPAAARAEVKFSAPSGSTLEAKQGGPDVATAGGIEKECLRVEFTGLITEQSRTLSLAPLYSECEAKALNGLPAKHVWWNCAYALHPFGGADQAGWHKAKVDFICPQGYLVEWNVYGSEEQYESGIPLCVTTMPNQRTGGTAELRSVGGPASAIAVRWHLSGIEYEGQGGNLLCGLLPGTVKSDATYTGKAVIAAKDFNGKYVDLTMSD